MIDLMRDIQDYRKVKQREVGALVNGVGAKARNLI